MDIRKTVIPNDRYGEPIAGACEREWIFFKVRFNNFRNVSSSTANEILDREEWDTCECCLCLPSTYTSDGEPTPLIISCHGAGGRVSESESMIGGIANVFPALDAGYAVLDVNGSAPSGKTIGCPEHVFALFKAYKHAVRHYNLSEQVLLAGSSMGGQTALNFANTFPSLVLAIGLFYPRLNMDGVTVGDHYCIGTWDKPKVTGLIRQFYRFPTEEWCEENVIGFNPYRSRSFVNGDGERGVIPPCPVKVWQGLEDQTVDPVMAEEFVRSIRRGGCYAELHLLEGLGHAPNHVMRHELVMWFNRFL